MKKIIRMLRPVLNWLFPESKNNEEAMKFYENQGLTTQRRVMEINI